MSKFEGDTLGVSPKQIEFIDDVLKKQGFGEAIVTIKPIGEAGDNYMANVKRIIAQQNNKIFRMVAKVAPTQQQLREVTSTHSIFINEYVMYSKVLPKFTALQEAANIPENERLRYAKFYGALINEPMEIILLEDLQEPGFVIFDRFKPIPDAAIRLILKDFAKLHACSYALKSKEPETFKDFKKSLTNQWVTMSSNENSNMYYANLEEDALMLLNCEKHKTAVKNTASKTSEITLDLYKTDAESQFSVIQQGDAWTNNIMFILEGDTPKECCMIDYQIANVNSPVADLRWMIFNCSDYKSRSKYFHEWINYYHAELDYFLKFYGLKSNDCYPKEQLYSDFKRHGKITLATTIVLASVLARQTTEAVKVKEAVEIEDMLKATRVSTASEGTGTIFKTRVGEVIDTLLELGYI